MIITIVDTETTGLEPATDRVVEIAAVFLDTETGRSTHLSSLIDPERDVPPESSAIHHITSDMLAGQPGLGAWLSRLNVVLDPVAAHNMNFDWPFLAQYLGTTARLICTYRCACHLWPDAPGHSNQTLRYFLGLKLDLPEGLAPHRALYDAIVTTEILRRQLMERSVEQLIELSALPVLQTKVRFGKYRGQQWSQMDAGFLGWILKQKFDEDVRHTARYHLERRRGS